MDLMYGKLYILYLLLAIFLYDSGASPSWDFQENMCVARHLCRIGAESNSPVNQFRHPSMFNCECPPAEICCNKSNVVLGPVRNFDQSRPPQCDSLQPTSMMKDHQFIAREAEVVPWMVALLHARNLHYLAGGSLVAPDVVLTATSVIENLQEYQLIVRAGEWNMPTNQQQWTHEDVSIRKIVRHMAFNRTNGVNNVALLFLQRPLALNYHINLSGLPPANRMLIYDRCIASAWVKNNFEDKAHMRVQNKVDVPLVDRSRCQRQLQRIFGTKFYLDSSLMCAGGEIDMGSCQGDRVSSLACPLQSDPKRYEQVGILTYGLGCGSAFPDVYTDVAKMRPWIDYQIQENAVAHQPQDAGDGEELPRHYLRNL